MKHFAFFCFLLSACAVPGRAGTTLLQRETFQGVGTLDATRPGNLGTVDAGSFPKRPVGPRLTGDTSAQSRGWSVDAQGQTNLEHTFSGAGFAGAGPSPTASQPITSVRWWAYLGAPLGDGSNGKTLFACQPNQNLLYVQVVGSDGLTLRLDAGQNITAPTVKPYALAVGVWTEFQVVFQQIPGYYDYQLAFLARHAGDPAWTEVASWPDTRPYANVGSVHLGFIAAGGVVSSRARYGLPGVYALDAWSDRLSLTPGVVDPSAGPFDWYVDPVNGDDGHDGTTPATAWQSAAKVNAESANLGLFPAVGSGDSLTIDTTAANLPLGPVSLELRTRGLWVKQLGGGLAGTGEIQAWTALPAGGWTLVGGAARTYRQTLSESNPSCVLWENDKWLNHPTGTNLAAVQPALESTPGSFWTDGTTMYVHPFGDTNPAADGKTYTRSYHRNAPFGGSAVMRLVPDIRLSGLRVRKTCLAVMDTNDPVSAYCYQTSEGAGGTCLTENCYGDYGSKHVFGFTDDDLNRHYTTTNCQAEQGSPYVVSGGATPWVDYADNQASNGTATHVYTGCTTRKNSGLIGSTVGQDRGDIPAWITHNNGGTAQFAEIDFSNCNLAGSLGGGTVLTTLRYTGGSCDGAKIDGTQAFFTGVLSTLPLAASNGGSMTARGCILPVSYLNVGGSYPVSGTNDFQGCTVDCGALASNTANPQMYLRTGPLNMTWRNNLFLNSPRLSVALLAGAASTDTLTFDHNAYVGIGALCAAYNDGSATADRTLPQWQSLGKDANSFATTNPLVDTSYRPLPGSPLIDAGANLGNVVDFTGRLFPRRNDIGAVETFPGTFAQYQNTYFTAAQLSNPAVSGDQANPAGDGLVNLLKYAFNLDPAAVAPASARPTVQVGNGTVSLTYTKALAAADLTYMVEQSTNLLQWSAATPTNTVLGTDGDAQQVRASVPAGTNQKLFLRLRVSR